MENILWNFICTLQCCRHLFDLLNTKILKFNSLLAPNKINQVVFHCFISVHLKPNTYLIYFSLEKLYITSWYCHQDSSGLICLLLSHTVQFCQSSIPYFLKINILMPYRCTQFTWNFSQNKQFISMLSQCIYCHILL